MASLIQIRQTLFERHCQSIHQLETNYMNRINQLLQMKTVILIQLEQKYYNQLNKINDQLKTGTTSSLNPTSIAPSIINNNTYNNPIITNNIQFNTIPFQPLEPTQPTQPTQPIKIKMELPKVLPIETQIETPDTFVIQQQTNNKALTPFPPSININRNQACNNDTTINSTAAMHMHIKSEHSQHIHTNKHAQALTLFAQRNNYAMDNHNHNNILFRQNNHNNIVNIRANNDCKYPHCHYSSHCKASLKAHVQKHWNVMREFKPGNTKFDIAVSRLRSMRNENVEGNLPSLRGFMKIVHLGFPKANAVLKYYAEKEMNMSLDDFKQRYMVLRQIKNSERDKEKEKESIKKYQCSYCRFRFESQSIFQKHIDGHIKNKPFECAFCKKRFMEQTVLKQHVQKMHLSICFN